MGSTDVNMSTSNFFRLSSVLVCLLVALSDFTHAQNSKWCPREVNNNRCRSPQGKFQCGLFFDNLLGDGDILWITALPGAFRQVAKKDHDKIFPRLDGKPLKESDFNSNNCGNANNVCYALFDQIKSKSLASTEETIGNLSGKKSAGDALCEQAQRFLKNRGIKKDVLNQKCLSTSPAAGQSDSCFFHSEWKIGNGGALVLQWSQILQVLKTLDSPQQFAVQLSTHQSVV